MMKELLFFVLFLAASASTLLADRTDVITVNPQGTLKFQRRQTGSNDGGDLQYIDLLDLKSRKIIFSFTSSWRSTDGGWSPDGKSACINDHIATSGDFLYIFRIVDDHPVLLRHPGSEDFSSDLADIYSKRDSQGRFTLTGVDWLSNSSLRVRTTGGGYGDNNAAFDSVIHIDAEGKITFDPKSIGPIH